MTTDIPVKWAKRRDGTYDARIGRFTLTAGPARCSAFPWRWDVTPTLTRTCAAVAVGECDTLKLAKALAECAARRVR